MTSTQVHIVLLLLKAFFLGVKLASHPDLMDVAKDLIELFGELALFAMEARSKHHRKRYR